MAAPMPYGMPPAGQMYYPGAPAPYGAGRGQMMGYPQQMNAPQRRPYGPPGQMGGMPQMPGYPQPYPQYPQPGGRVSLKEAQFSSV